MAGVPTPPILREPIASAAGGSFITNPMPESPTGTNAASIEGGFPPETMTSELAGGKPPLGQDMNGFLFLLSSHAQFLQAGQPYLFDADVAASISGYLEGTILGMADGTGIWWNSVNANVTDPDSSLGIVNGWRPIYSYGPAFITITGGITTVSVADAKKSVLILSGTLTSNATVVLPAMAQEWLVINLCSGAFSVNANAGSGASVTIPPGGFGSPLGVYTISDGNLYPTVAPLSIPISQGPDPSTIAERTNAGWLLATAFNSNIAQDDLAISSIWYETANDGFMRKMSLLSLESQMALGNIAGQLINAQVPYAVVQQWAATFFTNAALTGVPTAPTAAAGTATTQIATTAFVNQGSGVNANGSFRRNPDGSIDQWGSFAFTANGGTTTRSFPVNFPSAVESIVIGVPYAPGGLGGAGSYQADQPNAPTTAGFSYRSISASNPAIQVYWEAKGR